MNERQQEEFLSQLKRNADDSLRESEAARLGIAPEEVSLDGIGFIYTNRRENGRMYGLRGVQSALTICAHHILSNPSMSEDQIIEVTLGTLQTLREKAVEIETLSENNPEALVRVTEIYNRGRGLMAHRAVQQLDSE